MTIPQAIQLATDPDFRLFAGLAAPIRAGIVTAIEASGQLRVLTDAADGEDALAWPLNGFTYAVNDIVYIASPQGTPDSAIVIGARSPAPLGPTIAAATTKTTPADADELPLADSAAANLLKALSWSNLKATLKTYFDTLYATVGGWIKADGTVALTADWDIGSGRKLKLTRIDARDANGIALYDDGGNLVLLIEDGGSLGIGGVTNPTSALHLEQSVNGGVQIQVINPNAGAGAFTTFRIANETGGGGAALNCYVLGTGYTTSGQYIQDSALFEAHVNLAGGMSFSVAHASAPIRFYTNGVLRALIDGATGNIGLGVAAPQGKLHAHNGTGGMLFVTKTGIVNATQTIIPNGTGDIIRGISYLVVVTDGTVSVQGTGNLGVGGNHDIGCGTLTLRLSVAADGSMTCIRQAGTGTATLALLGIWL